MTLIDRYLHAVRGYLPAPRQDDIIRELSDDLHAQVGDREEELGRPLTEDEQEAFLKRLGHPLMLAARYQPQQHLVGPTIFPVYWQALKIALGSALAVQFALAVARVVSGTSPDQAIGALVAFPFGIAVTVFGWVTLVFALIDRNMSHFARLSRWDPRQLPAEGAGTPDRNWTLLAEIVFSSAFLVWWLAVPRHPFLMFGPGAAFLTLAPVWQQVHLAIAVIWAISLVSLWAFLLRPDLARYRAIGRILSDVVGLVIAVVLYRAAEIVTLADGVAQTADLTRTVDLLNRLLHLCLLIGAAGTAWQIVRRLYRVYLPAGGRL